MKVLITGTAQGIGKAIAELFLAKGHYVFGIDRQNASIKHEKYTHFVCDVRDKAALPDMDEIDILNVEVDVRPYNWEVNGKTGRTAYLQSIFVTQEVDRFADRFE